ncbi:zinc finger protein 436 [Dunckerocampus dactyliophorus]|uniref:zinc finger protein 436 n=1 Tax=Dunckerocampus dactyliophorus TaxID=161453 RepID=UPI0024058904|nr:zinc finger protein 436 [Dunckerocampus dactyliophorus]
MADPLVTFQSQLSGVMETVFKAAMYEITRLVEDSFMEEVARCRQQVERLKRRLKWSESRRKEMQLGDGGLKCADYGGLEMLNEEKPEVIQPEHNLKQECGLQEDMQSQDRVDGQTSRSEEEAGIDMKASQSSNVQNVDRLLKEEALGITPEANDPGDLDETQTSAVPGPSKHTRLQRKSPINWEAFDQRLESSQTVGSGNQSEAPPQSRYVMDDIKNSGYGDTSMIDIANLEVQGSSQPGDDVAYTGHYQGEVDAPEEAEQQTFQTGEAIYRGGTGLRTSADLREFPCLLINEEGYIQNQSLLHPTHASSDRLSYQDQSVDIHASLGGAGDLYGPSKAFHACDNAHPRAWRGARGLVCNQPFPSPAAPKAHKQTFTQACPLNVHQKIHSGQGIQLCSRCGKGFPTFFDLKTHRCGQAGNKPYCCAICGNEFSRLWNLKLHQRIHTQEKPHQCATCHKSFTRADILKVHQRTHTGERPYCCTVCSLSFKRLDHLKSHQRKHLTHL